MRLSQGFLVQSMKDASGVGVVSRTRASWRVEDDEGKKDERSRRVETGSIALALLHVTASRQNARGDKNDDASIQQDTLLNGCRSLSFRFCLCNLL